jgi:hypothetical protein
MWLDVVAPPDPVHAGLADALVRRHCPTAPMRASFRFGLQRSVNHGLDSRRIICGLPAPTRGNLPKRLGPAGAEALAPKTHGLTVHAALSSDGDLSFAGGNG